MYFLIKLRRAEDGYISRWQKRWIDLDHLPICTAGGIDAIISWWGE